jgi:hypothetical protein
LTSQPTVAIEKIDAKQAKKYLNLMVADQRSEKTTQVTRLVQELLSGEWQLVPDAIAFNSSGKLWNGQHRLRAIVEASKINPSVEAEFIVLRHVTHEGAMDVTDRGVGRSLADSIYRRYAGADKARSHSWAVKVAAAVNKAYLLDTKRWRSRSTVPTSAPLHWLEQNEGIFNSIQTGENVYRSTGVNASICAAVHYLISRDCDPAKADEFFDAIKSDLHPEGSPIRAMRRRISNLKSSAVTVEPEYHVHLLLRTWNYWLKGDTVHLIKVNPTDPFPSWKITYQALND